MIAKGNNTVYVKKKNKNGMRKPNIFLIMFVWYYLTHVSIPKIICATRPKDQANIYSIVKAVILKLPFNQMFSDISNNSNKNDEDDNNHNNAIVVIIIITSIIIQLYFMLPDIHNHKLQFHSVNRLHVST